MAGGAILAASCGGAGEDGPPEAASSQAPPAAVDRARQAVDLLATTLQQRLQEALREGGPARAVEVCARWAQPLTEEHWAGDLIVRRVSLRVRNPKDRPDAFEARQLQRLEELHQQGRLPAEISVTVREDGRRVLRYLRPILVVPLCLECHGDPQAMDPEVLSRLQELYPGDEALGYKAGDLRGAFSVKVFLDPPGPMSGSAN